MRKDVLVENVDIDLLRKQRDNFLSNATAKNDDELGLKYGLMNLLDYMIDTAEGFKEKQNNLK